MVSDVGARTPPPPERLPSHPSRLGLPPPPEANGFVRGPLIRGRSVRPHSTSDRSGLQSPNAPPAVVCSEPASGTDQVIRSEGAWGAHPGHASDCPLTLDPSARTRPALRPAVLADQPHGSTPVAPPKATPWPPQARLTEAALGPTLVVLSEPDPLALLGRPCALASTQVAPSTRHQSPRGLPGSSPESGVRCLPGDGDSHLFWIFLAPSLLLRLRHLAPPPSSNSRRCDRHAPYAQAQSGVSRPRPQARPPPPRPRRPYCACASPSSSACGLALVPGCFCQSLA